MKLVELGIFRVKQNCEKGMQIWNVFVFVFWNIGSKMQSCSRTRIEIYTVNTVKQQMSLTREETGGHPMRVKLQS